MDIEKDHATGNEPLVEIFWTGGFDSSFRVIQLSRYKVIIQPYYMVDNKYRRSIENELNAISEITEDIRANPQTKCIIRPLIKINVDEIDPDHEIDKVRTKLAKEIALGTQYGWLARFAKANPGIELCLEKDETGHIFNYFNTAGSVRKITNGILSYLEIDRSNSSKDLVTIFGNFRFPWTLREITKLDMVELYRNMGYDDTMQKTWFCHNPVNNEPCGVCNPCKIVVKDGLSFRLTPAGLKRYKLDKRYEGRLWFKAWKKIRWRVKGY